MSDRILELAKKLKALAERGEGGEKINAEEQLKRLVEKYNLELDDIENVRVQYRIFKFEDSNEIHKKFVKQIISSVIGDKNFYYAGLIHNNWAVEIDDFQYVEISEKIDFYWPMFKADLEIFYTAFIQKNELTLIVDEDKMPKFTEQEIEKLRQAYRMMQTMQKHTFKKLLNDNNEKDN